MTFFCLLVSPAHTHTQTHAHNKHDCTTKQNFSYLIYSVLRFISPISPPTLPSPTHKLFFYFSVFTWARGGRGIFFTPPTQHTHITHAIFPPFSFQHGTFLLLLSVLYPNSFSLLFYFVLPVIPLFFLLLLRIPIPQPNRWAFFWIKIKQSQSLSRVCIERIITLWELKWTVVLICSAQHWKKKTARWTVKEIKRVLGCP